MAVELKDTERGFFRQVERIWQTEELRDVAKRIGGNPDNIAVVRVHLAIAAAHDERQS